MPTRFAKGGGRYLRADELQLLGLIMPSWRSGNWDWLRLRHPNSSLVPHELDRELLVKLAAAATQHMPGCAQAP